MAAVSGDALHQQGVPEGVVGAAARNSASTRPGRPTHRRAGLVAVLNEVRQPIDRPARRTAPPAPLLFNQKSQAGRWSKRQSMAEPGGRVNWPQVCWPPWVQPGRCGPSISEPPR